MTSTLDERQRFTRRSLLLGGVKGILFLGLGARMYQLQIANSDRYAALAENNRIRVKFLAPKRGLILDRFGRPLALNRPTYQVSITPEAVSNLEDELERLSQLVFIEPEQRARILRQAKRSAKFLPIVTHENLNWDQIAQISSRIPELPGVDLVETSQRVYPEAEVAAHAIGYVGPADKKDLAGDRLKNLPNLQVGKAGIERSFDQQLRGEVATSKVEVNAVGRVIRELEHDPGASGDTLISTIDSQLQNFAQNRLGEDNGAITVIDVQTGDVLALASNPTFDPNVFTQGLKEEVWQALLNNPSAPLNNRAISGQYPPGSTFKMLVAMAALEARVVTPKNAFFCSGVHELGAGRFHCWQRGGHGWVALHDAIAESCDVYFYEIARKVGIEKISEMARRFGLGQPTGIDSLSEKAGLIPTKAWKARNLKASWQIGETLIAGIGQGFVLATPLQLAVMTARLVNGGISVTPRILRKKDEEELPLSTTKIDVSPENLRAIMRAMRAVTSSATGTARMSQISVKAYRMGGKTGTSQVRRITAQERRLGGIKNDDLPLEQRDHSLFVGYAPLSNPKYACSVVLEHGGSGSLGAAPVARDVLLEAQMRKSANWNNGAPNTDAARAANALRSEG
ncbi:MAG: penicillin-binding protein 2 [Rhodospirillales bacterium]